MYSRSLWGPEIATLDRVIGDSTPPYTTIESYLAALETHGATANDLPLLMRKLRQAVNLARRVQVTNKHGWMETGRRGDCAADCTKCLADTLQKIEAP